MRLAVNKVGTFSNHHIRVNDDSRICIYTHFPSRGCMPYGFCVPARAREEMAQRVRARGLIYYGTLAYCAPKANATIYIYPALSLSVPWNWTYSKVAASSRGSEVRGRGRVYMAGATARWHGAFSFVNHIFRSWLWSTVMVLVQGGSSGSGSLPGKYHSGRCWWSGYLEFGNAFVLSLAFQGLWDSFG